MKSNNQTSKTNSNVADGLLIPAAFADTPEYKILQKKMEAANEEKDIAEHVPKVLAYLNKRLKRKFSSLEKLITAFLAMSPTGPAATRRRMTHEDKAKLNEMMTAGKGNTEIRAALPNLTYNQVNNYRNKNFKKKDQ